MAHVNFTSAILNGGCSVDLSSPSTIGDGCIQSMTLTIQPSQDTQWAGESAIGFSKTSPSIVTEDEYINIYQSPRAAHQRWYTSPGRPEEETIKVSLVGIVPTQGWGTVEIDDMMSEALRAPGNKEVKVNSALRIDTSGRLSFQVHPCPEPTWMDEAFRGVVEPGNDRTSCVPSMRPHRDTKYSKTYSSKGKSVSNASARISLADYDVKLGRSYLQTKRILGRQLKKSGKQVDTTATFQVDLEPATQ
ncbi:hypothetical protein I302_108916 [Kwoniella bestiolae CBS 10118]|uniref:Uncharacterized protein n=1 Tax=Kwoniella bestiolae CBS 10118 TaxID=1296100 RepID=A0A1B9FUG2_9TREE|nr:hypothetical protein I302_08056 [Kwoniella bestiolae CBS 10118]OCF22408.1 hypothetical protein I302_08056 [Kwoniella bestiolae CBS 10118]